MSLNKLAFAYGSLLATREKTSALLGLIAGGLGASEGRSIMRQAGMSEEEIDEAQWLSGGAARGTVAGRAGEQLATNRNR